MALVQSFTVIRTADNTAFLVTETTGAYDAVTNPGGYGAPNPDTGDFDAFTITVTPPDATTLLPTGTEVEIDVYPTFPSDADGTFTITSLMITGTADEVLPDGVWLFTMTASTSADPPVPYVTPVYVPFYEIAQCCVQNLALANVPCECSGNSVKIQSLAKAYLYLSLLRPYVVDGEITDSAIMQCEQWNKAAIMIQQLQDVCNNENCQGCNGCD